MISSTLAVLKSPASGVSTAVTGYPIGRGNGVSTVFVAPPEITAISALYRRDWQGNMALSASPRTNRLWHSHDIYNSAWTKQTDVVVTQNAVTAPDGSLTAASIDITSTPVGMGFFQARLDTFTGTYNIKSIYMRGDVGGEVVNIADPWLTSGSVICTLTTNWALYSLSENAQTDGAGIWVNKVSGNKFYAWGAQLETGTVATSRLPTTTTPVTVTDYTASGTTLTLAEVPALAAELTVDGTGVDLPLLQIGG